MIFTIGTNKYLARDPSAYGTDIAMRETRKKRYLADHPEDRFIPRELFRQRYAEWGVEIEETVTEAVITLSALLIPQEGAFEIGPTIRKEGDDIILDWSQAEKFVQDANAFEVSKVMDFFSAERTKAYVSYLNLSLPGETSDATTPTKTE